MERKSIFFDLDGTLTDSGEGIINSAIPALVHFGLEVPPREQLRVFVGPPLHETFGRFGVPEDKLDEAVAIYRSRYVPIGKFENTPYPGIRELLQTLKDHGHKLYVATSKPEALSIEILEHFDLAQYFEIICGASLDLSRYHKAHVIAYLLTQVEDAENILMVGDTKYDVLGAAEHRIPTIGVAWGYGTVEDMVTAGAAAIARDPAHLLELLEK
jgi:phosphoglycolate phosphatase